MAKTPSHRALRPPPLCSPHVGQTHPPPFHTSPYPEAQGSPRVSSCRCRHGGQRADLRPAVSGITVSGGTVKAPMRRLSRELLLQSDQVDAGPGPGPRRRRPKSSPRGCCMRPGQWRWEVAAGPALHAAARS